MFRLPHVQELDIAGSQTVECRPLLKSGNWRVVLLSWSMASFRPVGCLRL